MDTRYTWGRGNGNIRGCWEILSYPAGEKPSSTNTSLEYTLPPTCEEWQARAIAALLNVEPPE